MTNPTKRRVLLVGWSAADWNVIHPLLDSGALPALKALIERGTMGNLASALPLPAASLWTSLATGKRADQHGVLTVADEDPDTGVLRPISIAARSVKAVWDILGARGLTTHLVGWPASHPAETVNGIAVSQHFAKAARHTPGSWPLAPSSVSPARHERRFAALRLHPQDLDGAHLLPFVPRAAEIDQTRDRRLAMVASLVAHATSNHAVATWILENEPWDLMAVHYGALLAASRSFLAYHPPKTGYVGDEDFALYRDTLNAFYRFHDMMLARLLELAGPEATVILVSEHGARTGDQRPHPTAATAIGHARNWRRDQGILVLAGPDMKPDALIDGASIYDIAPTILSVLGQPVGADMAGEILFGAFATPPAVERVSSLDDPAGEPELDEIDQALSVLRALGHPEPMTPTERRVRAEVAVAGAFNRARALIDAGRPAEAAPILQDLHAKRPEGRVVTLALAHCHHLLGRRAEVHRLVGEVIDTELDGPVIELLRANLAVNDGRASDALAHLQRATDADPSFPEVHCQMARLYSRLGREEQAEAAFDAAIAADPDYARTYLGLALFCLRRERFMDAAAHALQCATLAPRDAGAHYLLGVALARLGRLVRASQAFEMSLKLRPDWDSARKWLTVVQAQRLKNAALAHAEAGARPETDSAA